MFPSSDEDSLAPDAERRDKLIHPVIQFPSSDEDSLAPDDECVYPGAFAELRFRPLTRIHWRLTFRRVG